MTGDDVLTKSNWKSRNHAEDFSVSDSNHLAPRLI